MRALARMAVAVGALAAVGCVEERIVTNRPFLSGIPGAQTGRPVTPIEGLTPVERVPDDQITIVDEETGETTLIAKNGRHLMVHIYRLMESGDAELFAEQVLSTVTRREFIERGLDPKIALAEIQRRRADVMALFDRMPDAEASPGVLVSMVGKGAMRVKLSGLSAHDLKWVGIDMVLERGNWKLRWFVTPTAPKSPW